MITKSFVYYLVAMIAAAHELLVHLEQGSLRGVTLRSRTGRPIFGFLKIPYAEPPLGQLRFKAPQKPSPWEGIRNATEDGVVCTQRNVYIKSRFHLSGDEDCLYVNVYTPRIDKDDLLPVMVFFHGGGWITGSGNSKFYPPTYLLDKDVVFVGVNFRLGPLGFLSLEDSELPGNWGLKDQNQALRWIQKNIQAFGGNPDSVTIFGESAGGSSVHFHMVSPMSRGLFHKGISQSGTAFCSWALGHPGTTRNNTLKLAQLLHCPSAPAKALASCLRRRSAQDITLQDIHFMEWYRDPMIPFKPVVEKLAHPEEAFLPEHPREAIEAGRVAQVPWMTGLNSGDGALRAAAIYDDDQLVQELNLEFNRIIPMSLFLTEPKTDLQHVTNTIRNFYFGDGPIDNSTINKVVNLWTDGWFLAGANEAVKVMSRHAVSPVYYYYFSYRGTSSFSGIFGDKTRDFGVCHADELLYLFPMSHLFPKRAFSESDIKYTKIFLELWVNFATTGNPTPKNTDLLPVRWLNSSPDTLDYLHLSQDRIAMRKNLLRKRTRFWTEITDARNHIFTKDELYHSQVNMGGLLHLVFLLLMEIYVTRTNSREFDDILLAAKRLKLIAYQDLVAELLNIPTEKRRGSASHRAKSLSLPGLEPKFYDLCYNEPKRKETGTDKEYIYCPKYYEEVSCPTQPPEYLKGRIGNCSPNNCLPLNETIHVFRKKWFLQQDRACGKKGCWEYDRTMTFTKKCICKQSRLE